jgi:hypothetical protein
LCTKKVCGEADSVNLKEVVRWSSTILLLFMAKYSPKAIEYLEKYEHFLCSDTDVPGNVVKSLWNVKMCTETDFQKSARQLTLDKYFKEKSKFGMNCELVNEKSVTLYLNM